MEKHIKVKSAICTERWCVISKEDFFEIIPANELAQEKLKEVASRSIFDVIFGKGKLIVDIRAFAEWFCPRLFKITYDKFLEI